MVGKKHTKANKALYMYMHVHTYYMIRITQSCLLQDSTDFETSMYMYTVAT